MKNADPLVQYLAQDALTKISKLEAVLDDLFPKAVYERTEYKKLLYSLRCGVEGRLKEGG